jgi:hypothetical protein
VFVPTYFVCGQTSLFMHSLDKDRNRISYSKIQSNLCTTATLGTPKLRPLLTGGRCSEVGHTIQFVIGPSKWWPL